MKIERILVASDFSAAGERALRTASAWAHRDKAALRIVHVAPPKRLLSGFGSASASTIRGVYQQAATALQRLADVADPARELDVSTGLLTGSASKEIARVAADFNSDAIVIGARGEHETATRQPGLGGTATKLMASTPVPLMLVRSAAAGSPPATVLAAVDLSPASTAVLEWASWCATTMRLYAFHAYEVAFAARLRAYGIAGNAIDVYSEDEHAQRDQQLASLIASAAADRPVQRIVERGDAATLLFEHIQRLDADLVVLGKHTRIPRGASRTAYGSVCRHAALFAPCDVLIVPPRTSG